MSLLSSSRPVSIRETRLLDCEDIHELTLASKWPHRLNDIESLQRLGRGLVAQDDDGTIVGSITWWSWGENFATLGLVVVAEQARGQKVGSRLMDAAHATIGDRTIALNATLAGLSLYEKYGYRPTGIIEQRQAIIGIVGLSPLPEGMRLRPLGRSDRDRLIACDTAATGVDRSRMLDDLLRDSDVIILDQDGEIDGFAFCRRFGRGLYIGPTIATSRAGATALIGHFLTAHTGHFVRIDITGESGVGAWLDEIGLPTVDTATRMVRGTLPATNGTRRRYSLCTQALG